MIELSIIIPTFNRKDLLLRCLEHLKAQTYPAQKFEVIIAIDGSTDGTNETLQTIHFPFQLTVLDQENRGPAAARNLGANRATGNYLLFLDDDILATPKLIEEHLSTHKQHPLSIVVGPTPMSPDTKTAAANWQRDAYQKDIERLNRWGFDAIDHYFCLGANGSLARELFERSKGFDESLHSEGDETELGLRLMDLGAHFRWNPKAIGHHYWVKTDDVFTIADRRRRVINEVEILKRDPRFRVLSRFSDLFTGPRLKIFRRKMIARFPGLTRSIARIGAHLFPRGMQVTILKGLSAAAFWQAYREKFGDPFQLTPSFNKKLPILMYHLIRDDLPASDVVISVNNFTKQMEFLRKKGYIPISLSDWSNWVLYDKPLPAKPVALTFDDGFADLYEKAWPVLRSYGFRWSAFVVTGQIGRTNQWNGIEPGKLPLITKEQMREMNADGALFEAHSQTHPYFLQLEESRLMEEVHGCKEDLRTILGHEPQFFAYPYGQFHARERKCVSEAGYKGACTTIQGLNTIRTDLYRLRRINISGKDSMLDFQLKLRYGAGFLSWSNLKESVKLFLKEQFGVRKKGSNLENLL